MISSAGRRVELIECFRRAARELGSDLHVAAADAAPELSAACHLADAALRVPRCDTPEFVPSLLEICSARGIQLIVPTIDPELRAFAGERGAFQQSGALAAVSSPEVIAIARNKLETHRFFTSLGVRTPETFPLSEALANLQLLKFPAIVKPLRGSASIGVKRVDNRAELEGVSVPTEDYIVQEFVPGREYTVNIFFDRERLRCAVPHWRIETRAGEVSKGITEKHPGLLAIAEKIGEALAGRAFGALCFQAIVDQRAEASVIELNARFGGGYPLTDHAGAPFARWLLELAAGRPCSAHDNWRSGVQMLRYDASVFTP
jgi:carbamoyl-phosphate synthase large subunit